MYIPQWKTKQIYNNNMIISDRKIDRTNYYGSTYYAAKRWFPMDHLAL